MTLKTLLIPALAMAGLAAAQTSDNAGSQCGSSSTYKIQNAGDARAIAGCQTYTGDIAIAPGTTDPIDLGSTLKKITGDLVADNAVGLPGLGGSALETIGGNFALTNMTLLTDLSFSRLTTVGQLNWQTLPRLTTLGFSSGVRMAKSVRIVDTQLGSLEGINLETVGAFEISNNLQLNAVDMQLQQVTGAWNVEFNGRNTSVRLPNLENAFNMTFRNVSSVTIPALASVNSSLGFIGCFFSSLSAPNLTSVGGSVSFVSNAQLTNVSFPKLSSIRGALQVANNTQYDEVDGFPAVSQVGGAVDVYGNFTDFQLPAIQNVAGAFNLQSTANLDKVCQNFQGMAGRDKAIKGQFVCRGEQTKPGGVGTPASDGGSSSSGKGNAAGATTVTRLTVVTGILGVFAALLAMF